MSSVEDARLTIAVTGAAGYIGQRLVRSLCAHEAVGRVIGFDIRPSEWTHPKFVFDEMDIRDGSLEHRFRGVDALVHLAFIMNPIKDESAMRDINVNGSQNLFVCAGRAGVEKIVYPSSATVYGAHADNPIPLTEQSPLRANLDFSYPAQKLEVEYVLREFHDEFPDTIVTTFRPAIVFGPNVDSAWSRVLEMPLLIGVKGCSPPVQFVHEDDVVAALLWAITNDLHGAYNLAPSDWMDSDAVLELLGRRKWDVPEPLAFSIAERLWSLGVSSAPAGMLHYVMYPWVVSPAKLEAAGFRCRHSTRDALQAAIGTIGGVIRIGDTVVRRGDLLRGAAAGAGLLGAVVGVRALRRRSAANGR
jgi:UDP-glucose 4-epimerase